jgi:chemotaxis protein CheD
MSVAALAPGLQRSAPLVHTLHPGDVVCALQGQRMETLLGSCVAIILTDPRRTVGAMCHIVHARPAPQAARDSGAYADVALAKMGALLLEQGIHPALCEAYVFGGGNMFPQRYAASQAKPHVGELNVDWALQRLAQDGVRVLLHHVGGNVYRRLGWTVGHAPPQVTAVPI